MGLLNQKNSYIILDEENKKVIGFRSKLAADHYLIKRLNEYPKRNLRLVTALEYEKILIKQEKKNE